MLRIHGFFTLFFTIFGFLFFLNAETSKAYDFDEKKIGFSTSFAQVQTGTDAREKLQSDLQRQQDAFNSGAGVTTGEIEDPRAIMGRIINIFLQILGILAVGYFLYGGYIFMMSGGESEQKQKAMNIIKRTTIGLAIILSAYAITLFVFNRMGGATLGGMCVKKQFCDRPGFECPAGSYCDTVSDLCVGHGCKETGDCSDLSGFTCKK